MRNGDVVTNNPINPNTGALATNPYATFLRTGVFPRPSTGSPINNNLSQPFISFAWPISQHWRTIGYWNYDLADHYAQQYFLGLEYDSCCWAMRAILSRNFSNLDQNLKPVMENEFYFQFLLRGLGSIGTSNADQLTQMIPNYKDPFGGNINV